MAIVDWDVHHGNGTQEIFWDDDSVLFASLHQWPFYPGSGGPDDGNETTVNVPLPAGSGDEDYLRAFDEVVAPAVRAFEPELVLVSAGFDAHVDDPLADMRVTADGFRRAGPPLGLARAQRGCGTRRGLRPGHATGASSAPPSRGSWNDNGRPRPEGRPFFPKEAQSHRAPTPCQGGVDPSIGRTVRVSWVNAIPHGG